MFSYLCVCFINFSIFSAYSNDSSFAKRIFGKNFIVIFLDNTFLIKNENFFNIYGKNLDHYFVKKKNIIEETKQVKRGKGSIGWRTDGVASPNPQIRTEHDMNWRSNANTMKIKG